jgi:hypothetical protein
MRYGADAPTARTVADAATHAAIAGRRQERIARYAAAVLHHVGELNPQQPSLAAIANWSAAAAQDFDHSAQFLQEEAETLASGDRRLTRQTETASSGAKDALWNATLSRAHSQGALEAHRVRQSRQR